MSFLNNLAQFARVRHFIFVEHDAFKTKFMRITRMGRERLVIISIETVCDLKSVFCVDLITFYRIASDVHVYVLPNSRNMLKMLYNICFIFF